MKKLLAAALIAVLSGCITNGPKIDSARLEEFRVGQTTATQIFSQFGRPNFLSKNMDGTQTAVYVHAEDGPVVGTLAGTAETVTFSFDDRGVLSELKYRPPGAARPAPDATARSLPPSTTGNAPAAGTAAAPSGTATAAAANTAGSQTAGVKPAAAARPAETGSNVPYLWDILRSTNGRDPRSQ